MKPIRPTGHATVFQSCLLALALAVAGSRSQAAPVPICPLLGSPPYPAYGELDGPPKVETWHELDLQQGPGCIGPAQGPMSLVVALAGRFTHSGSIEDLATRIGAISSTEGLKYWSTTEVRWQVMIAKAFALDDPTTGSARPDFTAAEIFGARSLYFAQDETRTTGTNVYSLSAELTGSDRLVVTIMNLTTIRFSFINLFEPRSLLSIHFIERLEPDIWGYYGLSAARNDSIWRYERSFINRAAAYYRFIVGEPATKRPPLAP